MPLQVLKHSKLATRCGVSSGSPPRLEVEGRGWVPAAVLPACFRSPMAVRRETYQWARKAKSSAKQSVNSRLAQLATELWPKTSSQWALLLDSPSMSSASALKAAGFQPQRIVVPNDSDARFPTKEKKAVLLRMSLGDFLRQNATTLGLYISVYRMGFARTREYGPFSCVYCDFTQCLDGSWKPSQELEDLSLSWAPPAASPLEECPNLNSK